jgi:hypothetical protein
MGHLRGRNPGGTIVPRGTTRREGGSILQAPFDTGAAIVFLKDSCLHRRSDPVMKRLLRLPLLALPLLVVTAAPADPSPRRVAKDALRPFNDLIGSWRGTGEPSQGTQEEKRRNFWQETIRWEWQFKGDDVFLKMDTEKGKYFTAGELRPLPEAGKYRLNVTTVNKETLTFEGAFEAEKKRLVLERVDEKTKETQRLVFNLLHSNRHLMRYESKKADQVGFTAVWMVGATKEGVAFAEGDDKPECVVSGGLGTMPVTYKGKTYYVCCSGCRDAFRDEPEKYIREFEERQAAKKKGGQE